MSAFYRVQNQRDVLEDRVDDLERELRLMRQQYARRVEERDALKAERDELLAERGGEA